MIIKGKVYRFGDNINTDYIISGRYKFSITDMKVLAQHAFEDIDPEFSKKIQKGRTILVAGRNFGMGSSREQAPLVLKEAGIQAVVAKSFARIFFRNAFNIGLPLVEADTSSLRQDDAIEIDLEKGILHDFSQKRDFKTIRIPQFMMKLLADGGLIKHFEKNGRIEL